MPTDPPASHQARFLRSLRFDQPDPIEAYADSVRIVTGAELASIIPGRPEPPNEQALLLIALATLTVARIRDHWDRIGEPERGERVANAFAWSMQLGGFWAIASSPGFFFAPTAVKGHPLRSAPGNQLMERPLWDDCPTNRLIKELLDASSTEDLETTISDNDSLITEAAEEGDWHFFQLLGEAIGEAIGDARSSLREHPEPWDFRIPENAQRGSATQFARIAWLSHLYWLMPPGVLAHRHVLNVTLQVAKDTSRYDLPRADKPVIEFVRDGEDSGEAKFRFGGGWDNGPEVLPSDYPRES